MNHSLDSPGNTMKRLVVTIFLTSVAAFAGRAHAFGIPLDPGSLTIPHIDLNALLLTWTCVRGDGAVCGEAEIARTDLYKQILVLPTGYTESEHDKFFEHARMLRETMSNPPGTTVFTEARRDRLLYITYWLPGGELSTAGATFGGAVRAHPVRGKALTMVDQALYDAVADITKNGIPKLAPAAVAVLFDSDEAGVTSNAAPPNYTRRPFGVARIIAAEVQSAYLGAHEVAHALLSFVDEYVEAGFENTSVTSLDVLTPLAIWEGDLSSLDEIIASNGADNVATTQYPGTVSSARGSEVYDYEGGMFFGRGTFHDAGNNLMNSNFVVRGPADYFDYAHSPAQQRLIDTAFTQGTTLVPGRANDRLRNAGPTDDWFGEFGSNTTVMIYDADKNHRWQPTKSYDIQLGWYERIWKTCYQWGVIPYPCYSEEWWSVQKRVYPTVSKVQLANTSLYGLSGVVQQVVCGLGLGSLGDGTDLCTLSVDQMSNSFLPTLQFYLPYQTTDVAANAWFTTYYWRARSYNGLYTTAWTGWSSFYRSL
jgi:hypothetical protein